MYYYHVAYQWAKNGGRGHGIGSITITRRKPIETGQDVEELGEYIENKHGMEKVIIINWIPLKG